MEFSLQNINSFRLPKVTKGWLGLVNSKVQIQTFEVGSQVPKTPDPEFQYPGARLLKLHIWSFHKSYWILASQGLYFLYYLISRLQLIE